MLDILDTQQTNRPQREVANRHLILETAIRLGTENGWQKLTVRNLASELHYAPPVLYQFFKNKEDLMKAIVKNGFDQLKTELQKALDAYSKPSDQIFAFAKARYRFATENSALHALMFSPGSPEWHRQILSENIRSTHHTIHGLLKTLSGRTDNCNDLVLNLICIIKGYTFFTTEIYKTRHKKEIIGNLEPSDEFDGAIVRFIKAIQSDE